MGSGLAMMRLQGARDLLRKAGPYLLVEILLPGGTLLALLLFLYQRSQGSVSGDGGPPLTVVVAWALGKVREALAWMPSMAVWTAPRRGERDGLEALAMTPQN